MILSSKYFLCPQQREPHELKCVVRFFQILQERPPNQVLWVNRNHTSFNFWIIINLGI
jgi:hypothetical protein